jgi:hypothetical protein
MKKLILILVLLPFLSSAQEWSMGLRTVPQMNINLGSSPSGLSLVSTMSSSIGANYNFCYNLRSYYSHNKNSISFELLYQNYQMVFAHNSVATSNVKYSFQNIEIPILLHSRSDDYGIYGEAGAAYVNTLSQNVSTESIPVLHFTGSNVDAIIGFGLDQKLSKMLMLSVGARAYYPLLNQVGNSNPQSAGDSQSSLHLLRTGVVLGMQYYFDYFHTNNHRRGR